MTVQPTPTQPLPLDPATLAAMLRSTLDTLPHHPDATAEEIANRQQAAQIAIDTLRPRDPVEAILAARCVAIHAAVMENFRCAAQRGLPHELKLHYTGKAIVLSRLADAALGELAKRQARPALQPVASVPLPAPRPRPSPAAAQPDQPSKNQPPAPAAAAPAPDPTQPPSPPVLRQQNTAAPRSAILAPLTAAEAARGRMLDEIAARAMAPAAARAA